MALQSSSPRDENGFKCLRVTNATHVVPQERRTLFNDREELLEKIDDDNFDYEKPLDFVSATERRALKKEAGENGAKAIGLLSGSVADIATAEGEGSVEVKKRRRKMERKRK